MNLLRSMDELRAFLSPAENAAYLSDAWDDNAQIDMVSDEVKMNFTVLVGHYQFQIKE